MSPAIELFVIGITGSFGPCLAFCSPVILPYIAATRHSWREGLRTTLLFLFTRLVAYVLLGLLAGWSGRLLTVWLHQFDYLIFLGGGIFISFLGLLIIFGKEPGHRLCQTLRRQVVDNSIKGPILLGFTVGILPCLPLLGVLAYIALKTQNIWQGAFYGFAFGVGKFISPLVPFGVLASTLPAGLIKSHKVYLFFTRLCGFILSLIGINLLIASWRRG
jgi:sulfite exporter TauE/SafE